MKWKLSINAFILVFFVSILFENINIMIYGFIAVVVVIVFLWAKEAKKAAQDPNVIEASELGIPILRYRKYQEAWDKIQKIYEAYGIDSQKSYNMVNEIISKLPNMNEWRRYGDKQLSKTKKSYQEIQKEYEEYMKPSNDGYAKLFNSMKEVKGHYYGNEYLEKEINSIIISKEKSNEWKEYCTKRKDDIKTKILPYIPVSINLEMENGEYVKGEIKDYIFRDTWYKYEVIFEREVGLDEYWRPWNIHYLTEKNIEDIVVGKIKGHFG